VREELYELFRGGGQRAAPSLPVILRPSLKNWAGAGLMGAKAQKLKRTVGIWLK
jgi:hypothetical protein